MIPKQKLGDHSSPSKKTIPLLKYSAVLCYFLMVHHDPVNQLIQNGSIQPVDDRVLLDQIHELVGCITFRFQLA